jgi:hypothetical protein
MVQEFVINGIKESLQDLRKEQIRIDSAVYSLQRLFASSDTYCVRCGKSLLYHSTDKCQKLVEPIVTRNLTQTHTLYNSETGDYVELSNDGLYFSSKSVKFIRKVIDNLDEIFLNALEAIQGELKEHENYSISKVNEYIELLEGKKKYNDKDDELIAATVLE